MTAYIDRVLRLAGGQPSLRVRPRSRFEPVSPGSEPPWERAVLDVTVSPFDTESPFESDREAGTDPTGPRGNVPLTGDMAEKRPVPTVPADNYPDTAVARPWSSLSSERPPSSSPVPSASAVPERTVIRPPTTALPVSADPAETASSQTRSTRHAVPGDLSRRGEPPSVPPEGPRLQTGLADRASGSPWTVLAPASFGPRPTDPIHGNRSAARLAVPATRGSRSEANPEPDERVGPNQPVSHMDRALATPPSRRPEPADAAGPPRRRFSRPGDRAGLAEPAADDRTIGPPSGHPGVDRRKDARARPDEVTVTIGRIEVRVGPPPALADAAGAAKDRSSRPQPSRLEDYLQARASGRIG